MFDANSSEYSLQLMKRDIDDIRNYSTMLLDLVLETDKKPLQEEIDKIKTQYHIDHCWIKHNDKIIGVVKIIKNTFYSLGLIDGLSEEELVKIIDMIEQDILSYHAFKIETTVHERYLNAVRSLNYHMEYSRKKMTLNLKDVDMSIVKEPSYDIKEYRSRYLKDVTLLFIDAYKESVDEQIGMFSERIAHSAMNSIMKGSFGDFRDDLSGMIFDKDEMVAAVLVTILENCPFVVIIGVRRKYQGKSYGINLLSWVIRKVKEQSFSELKLWVTYENQTALKLYEYLGFKEILTIYALTKEFQ